MSDYEVIQKRRNVVVGIFVLMGICALIWLVFVFGDLPVTVSRLKSFRVTVQFPTAPGVQSDTPVLFCGYQVGRVTDVRPPKIRRDMITGREYHQALVELSINRKYDNIPPNIQVKIMTRGLGSSYIELKVDPSLEPDPVDPNLAETAFLADGMLLQGSTGMTSEFFPEESQQKLAELVDGIVSLVKNANDIIGDPQNKQNFKDSIAGFALATDRMAAAIEHFDRFLGSAIETSGQLAEMLSELRLVLEKINNGQGTIARLVNDGRLYENLLESTEQVSLMLVQVEALVEKSRSDGIPIKLK